MQRFPLPMGQNEFVGPRVTCTGHKGRQGLLAPGGRRVPKANLTLPDGTTVTIDGTTEEVAALLAKIAGPAPQVKTRAGGNKRKSDPASKRARTARKGPRTLINALATANWFTSKRTIGDVQKKLEEDGHIYALSSLSPALLRLTRAKVLRRIKDKDGWVYVS